MCLRGQVLLDHEDGSTAALSDLQALGRLFLLQAGRGAPSAVHNSPGYSLQPCAPARSLEVLDSGRQDADCERHSAHSSIPTVSA